MSPHVPDEYEKRYMRVGDLVVFREKVVSRAAFRVSVTFAVVFGLFGVGLFASTLAGVPIASALAFGGSSILLAATMGVLGVMFSVFRTMVTTEGVLVHFGWAKRKIPFSAIESVHRVKLSGFKQGKVSVGFDGVVRTWAGNSVSGRGVELAYREPSGRKHLMTIGSEQADRLAEAIEASRATTSRASETLPVSPTQEPELAGDEDHPHGEGERRAAD